MATKLYDAAVKVSTYTDNQTGQERGRYENIGAVFQGDDGGQFMVLKRTFNPAGVPFKPGSDSIRVSLFAPRDQQQGQPAQQRPNTAANTQTHAGRALAPQQAPTMDGFDDDLPF